MTLHVLLADTAFDSETTRLLGATFDAAWDRLRASGNALVDDQSAAATREALAKCIIAMVQQGERNPDRLIDEALARLENLAADGGKAASWR